MFTEELCTIDKTWEQPVALDRGMDKEDVLHVSDGQLLSHKKEWDCAIGSNVDGPRDFLSLTYCT